VLFAVGGKCWRSCVTEPVAKLISAICIVIGISVSHTCEDMTFELMYFNRVLDFMVSPPPCTIGGETS